MLVHSAACCRTASNLAPWRNVGAAAASRASAAGAAANSVGPSGRRSAAAAAAAASQPGSAAAAAASTSSPAVGDELELACSDLAFGGEGVCRLPGGIVLFVAGGLPGERLIARVTQRKKSFAKAVKVSTLVPHADAVQPECQHFGPCGGCSLQSLAYDAQLSAKQRQLAELLRRTGGVAQAELDAALRPPLGCPPGEGGQYAYRNKMEFSWGPQGAGQPGASHASNTGGITGRRSGGRASGGGASGFALGLHLPGSDTHVLPISRCRLQPDPANALLARVRELAAQAGLQPYDPASRTGLLQHVVIRRARGASSAGSSSEGGGGEEYLLNIVTAADEWQALEPLASALMREPLAPAAAADASAAAAPAAPPPRLVGVVNSVSARGRPTGERRLEGMHVLAGRGHLLERLCGLQFEVSANSFFQTNTPQAEVLYRLVAEAAELRPTDTLLDLYCGTGSIGLTLAAACARVVGVEISAAAVADAERNAARNGITNATFIKGDMSKLQLDGQLPDPDVVVVDPARPGLSPSGVSYLRAAGARRLVYVSCNASTQARDIKQLCAPAGGCESGGSGDAAGERQYRLVSVQAVDLYPHTSHCETVAVLDAVQ